MTAAPFVGWQRQDNGAVGAGRAGRRDLQTLRRTRHGAPARGAPMPACMRWDRWRISIWPKISRPTRCATRSIIICARCRSRCSKPRSPRRISTRGSRRPARHYLYRILCRRAPPALDARTRLACDAHDLDADAMHAAAQALDRPARFHDIPRRGMSGEIAGEDARPSGCPRAGDEIHIDAAARSFLHNQVRSMVGSLKLVGEGKWTPRDMGARSNRATAPHAARSRRRKGFIWCGWITLTGS